MATLLSAIETKARYHLKEDVASFWSSAELIAHMNDAIKDLWGAIIDLHQEHFLTVDITTTSLAVDGTQLSGVPADCFRVHLIEPLATTGTGSQVFFRPKDYNSDAFSNARAMSAQDPSNGLVVYYTLTTAGSPVAAPVILTAPKLSAAVPLRLAYVPGPAAVASGGNNPIPGESDNAIAAWVTAYARAKEREDHSPDPNWLAIYATEKANLLVRLTPRQTQEPDVVEDMFA